MGAGLRCLIVFAVVAATGARADDVPVGPPWTAVCQDFERDSFSLAFNNAQCQSDFETFFAAHSAAQTHAWMKERRLCFHEWAHFSWISFAQHSEKMAELAWRQQIYMADQRLLGGSCADHACAIQSVRSELARAETLTISETTRAHTAAFLDVVETNQKYEPQMTKAYAAVRGLCIYHLNVECIDALKQAFDWMYPRMYSPPIEPIEHFTFSMVAFYRKVFDDDLTQRYAARLALQLMDAVESGTMPANLYETGLTAFDGDLDRFWNFMIVYATRGAAWAAAWQLPGDDNRPVFAALMVVAAAMGVLDTTADLDGTAFSYAATTGFTCFQPKPYHFWLAGGFAYLLKKAGYTPRTSELVARLTGGLYEANSTTEGRHPDAVFFAPEFATIVNRERREITHHYMGAQLGLHAEAPPVLDFDGEFGHFLGASRPLPAMTEAEMKTKIADPLTRWQLWSRLTGYYR